MKIILFVLFIFALSPEVHAQKTTSAVLVEEFGEECVESVLARRDNFFSVLGNDRGSHGVIIFYGRNGLEGRNAKLVGFYSNFNTLSQKHLNSTINVVRGSNGESLKIQFWKVPEGSPEPQPETNYVAESYKITTLFDRAWADFNKWEGALSIYSDGFYDLGCWFSANRGLLASVLKENPTLKIHLIGYSGSETKASRARRVLRFAVSDLVKNYKIPRTRVSSIYGGKRQEPQIEFFLIPKGDNLPSPSPNPKQGIR